METCQMFLDVFWPDRVQSEVLRSDEGIQLSLLGA